MTSWFRRPRGPEPMVQEQDPDTPAALSADLVGLVRLVNRSAGRLPTAATVTARGVTDAVREILDCLSDDADPDVHAILSVRGDRARLSAHDAQRLPGLEHPAGRGAEPRGGGPPGPAHGAARTPVVGRHRRSWRRLVRATPTTWSPRETSCAPSSPDRTWTSRCRR